jgi:hypothetical protein
MKPSSGALSTLKSLRPQQGVEQVTQQAGSDEGGERIVKDHDPFSTRPFADVGVADLEHKKAEREPRTITSIIECSSLLRVVMIEIIIATFRQAIWDGPPANRLATLCLDRIFSVSAATTRIYFRDAHASNVIGIS